MNLRVLAITTGLTIAILIAGDGVGAPFAGQQPSTKHRSVPSHMQEVDRLSITSLAIVPAVNRAISAVGGDYNQRVSIIEAAWKGHYYGEQIGGLLCVYFLLCIIEPDLVTLAEVAGGLIGMSAAQIKNEIQEFRDGLAKSLKKEVLPSLTNDVMATEVYEHIRPLDYTDTEVVGEMASLPEGADRVLLVNVQGLQITIEGRVAVFETTVQAALRDVSTGVTIRANLYTYTDRDTLENWGENDNTLVANYIIFARNYFGQEIAADFFHKVELRHVLRPLNSDSVSGMSNTDWRGSAASDNPTLLWELILLGDDPYGLWATSISTTDIEYDLQVFDGYRLVYFATQISEPGHHIESVLEGCKSLRWSVRPRFNIGGNTRVGQWMRFYSDVSLGAGNFGTATSEEPAYLKGFPSLKTRCSES